MNLRSILLLLCIVLLGLSEARMSRKRRRALCKKRPELKFCRRLAAALGRRRRGRTAALQTSLTDDDDDEDDGGDYDPFPEEGAFDGDPVAPARPNVREFVPEETSLPSSAGPSTSSADGDFCRKWAGHNNYFCAKPPGERSGKVGTFCDKYAAQCPLSPAEAGPGLTSSGGVELIEEATPAPGGAIERLCENNRVLGERFCLRGTPPAGFEERCRQFRQFCVERPEERPDPDTLPPGSLAQRCAQYRGIGQRFCTTAFKREPEYEAFCFDYRKYCADVPGGEPRDFKTIANVFDSGVDLGDSFNVGGIPFYPFNPEGTIGVEDSNPISFGAWGGGFGTRQGVTDFWRREEDVGGNWYNGWYGQKQEFGVPMFGNLFSGVDESSVNVPIFDQKFGEPITVGDRFGFGPFITTGDTVGVDWFGGGVADKTTVGVPMVGIGVNAGPSVSFPSVGSILGGIPLGADKEVVDQLIEEREIRRAQLEGRRLPPRNN